MLMSNDTKIIEALKKALNVKTPDVLSPKDENGATRIRFKQGVNDLPRVDDILGRCVSVNTHLIDFKNNLKAENIEYGYIESGISIKRGGNVWESNGWVRTEKRFQLPVKIDDCVVNGGEPAFGLKFDGGNVKSASWDKKSGRCVIRDPHTAYAMDFELLAFSPAEYTELNISWIIHRSYMAVSVYAL